MANLKQVSVNNILYALKDEQCRSDLSALQTAFNTFKSAFTVSGNNVKVKGTLTAKNHSSEIGDIITKTGTHSNFPQDYDSRHLVDSNTSTYATLVLDPGVWCLFASARFSYHSGGTAGAGFRHLHLTYGDADVPASQQTRYSGAQETVSPVQTGSIDTRLNVGYVTVLNEKKYVRAFAATSWTSPGTVNWTLRAVRIA